MFSTFEQGAKQTENCMEACDNQKYVLQVSSSIWIQFATYSLKDRVIVT